MNKKIIILVIAFLLLVPFRLPIGVLFIRLITDIANITGDLTASILVANVVVTKLIYNIALSVISVYNIEMLSRSIKGRKAIDCSSESGMYWWTGVSLGFYVVYMIFDTVNTYHLFFAINN